MPVVRIVGSVPEGVCDLPQQLRDRGFEVEIVSDAANCEPGDLEITLEECSTEEALGRALALVQGHGIPILVSPGAISPVVPVLDSTEEQVRSADADVPLPVRDIATAAPIEPPAHGPEPAPVYLTSETHFEPPLEIATTFTGPADDSHLEEESVVPEETDVHEEHGALPAGDAEPPFLPVTERQDVPAALPDRDWAELERVAALPLNSEDDSDWPIWQAPGEEEEAPPPVVEPPQSLSPILTEQLAGLHNFGTRFLAAAQVNRILLDDRLFTKIAVVTTATAILLLITVGMAHRLSPLPTRILGGSSQASQSPPFQRVNPSPIPASASEVVAKDTAEPATSPVTTAPSQAHVLRAARSAPVRHRKSASQDDGYTARDTVVHYNQKAKRSLPETAKKEPGVKYYTDLKQ